MIHITEAEIGVLDSTGKAGQEEGVTKTLDCWYWFYESLIRSIIHCHLIDGIINFYVERGTRPTRYNKKTLSSSWI